MQKFAAVMSMAEKPGLWLKMIRKSEKISILSSEEGSHVVYTQKQVKELIETLKKCL